MSVRNKMNPNNRKHTFELFGFDFLLDEDFRVWLIEVNTNPSLATPTSFMRELVRDMFEDMTQIVVDPIFKPRIKPEREKENRFELIYREERGGKSYVNKRRPFNIDLCYPIPDLKPAIGGKGPTSKLSNGKVPAQN